MKIITFFNAFLVSVLLFNRPLVLAQELVFDHLFSIPTLGDFIASFSGTFLKTSEGYLIGNGKQIYFSEDLPLSFRDLEIVIDIPDETPWGFKGANGGVSIENRVYVVLEELAFDNAEIIQMESGASFDSVMMSVDGGRRLVNYFEDDDLGGRIFPGVPGSILRPFGRDLSYANNHLLATGFPLSFYRFEGFDKQLQLVGLTRDSSVEESRLLSILEWDFALIGNVIITGGRVRFFNDYVSTEGIDLGYGEVSIYRGELDATGHSLLQPFELIGDATLYNETTGLQERRLYAWLGEERTRTFFAVGQGVILRSLDLGRSFQIVQKYDAAFPVNVPEEDQGDNAPEKNYSPSLRFIATSGKSASQVLVLGFNYFGYSDDNGESWRNFRELLEPYGDQPLFLEEVADGEFYLGVSRRGGDGSVQVLRVSLPDPLAENHPAATYLGAGWWNLPWIGSLYGAHYPMLYVNDQKTWVWAEYFGQDSGWLWDFGLGWIWTSGDLFPWLFSQREGEWLYYWESTHQPRWFQKTDGSWVQE